MRPALGPQSARGPQDVPSGAPLASCGAATVGAWTAGRPERRTPCVLRSGHRRRVDGRTSPSGARLASCARATVAAWTAGRPERRTSRVLRSGHRRRVDGRTSGSGSRSAPAARGEQLLEAVEDRLLVEPPGDERDADRRPALRREPEVTRARSASRCTGRSCCHPSISSVTPWDGKSASRYCVPGRSASYGLARRLGQPAPAQGARDVELAEAARAVGEVEHHLREQAAAPVPAHRCRSVAEVGRDGTGPAARPASGSRSPACRSPPRARRAPRRPRAPCAGRRVRTTSCCRQRRVSRTRTPRRRRRRVPFGTATVTTSSVRCSSPAACSALIPSSAARGPASRTATHRRGLASSGPLCSASVCRPVRCQRTAAQLQPEQPARHPGGVQLPTRDDVALLARERAAVRRAATATSSSGMQASPRRPGADRKCLRPCCGRRSRWPARDVLRPGHLPRMRRRTHAEPPPQRPAPRPPPPRAPQDARRPHQQRPAPRPPPPHAPQDAPLSAVRSGHGTSAARTSASRRTSTASGSLPARPGAARGVRRLASTRSVSGPASVAGPSSARRRRAGPRPAPGRSRAGRRRPHPRPAAAASQACRCARPAPPS